MRKACRVSDAWREKNARKRCYILPKMSTISTDERPDNPQSLVVISDDITTQLHLLEKEDCAHRKEMALFE